MVSRPCQVMLLRGTTSQPIRDSAASRTLSLHSSSFTHEVQTWGPLTAAMELQAVLGMAGGVCSPADLLRLYVKHERWTDAAAVACKSLESWNREVCQTCVLLPGIASEHGRTPFQHAVVPMACDGLGW